MLHELTHPNININSSPISVADKSVTISLMLLFTGYNQKIIILYSTILIFTLFNIIAFNINVNFHSVDATYLGQIYTYLTNKIKKQRQIT